MTEKTDPFVWYRDEDGLIEGNVEGLIELRNAIDTVIESGYAGVKVNSKCDVLGVSVLSEESSEHREAKGKRNILGYIIGCIAFFWFVVLPFVAICLLAFIIFFSGNSKAPDCRDIHIQNILKEQYFKWRD